MVRAFSENDENTAVLIIQILAVIVVFAVPTAVLAIVLPKYSLWIVLGGTYLLFATAALFAGIGWHDPNYSSRARVYTLAVLIITVLANPMWRLAFDGEYDYPDFWSALSVRSALLLSPFVIGFLSSLIMRRQISGPKK